MDRKNKKEDILQTIQSTTDEDLIDEVYEILNADGSVDSIAISDLPEELQHKLNRALDDYQSGRYITHEQMQQKVGQWLTK